MMTLIDRYFEALQAKIAEIAARPEPIRQAARACADALARGGMIHVFDSGHMVASELINRAGGLVAMSQLAFNLNVINPIKARAAQPDERTLSFGYIGHVFDSGHMVASELINRAGGLVAMTQLAFNLNVINPVKARAAQSDERTLSFGYIGHVFETNQLRKGDVLFVGSVSGKTANVIELALQARAHGLTVVALTALAYSSKLDSEHPSGKRLYEAADLVLDNGAPYGDGMLTVAELEYPVCPASGMGAAAIMWAVVAGTVEEMLARGLTPTIFPSVNRPDGKALVSQAEAEALRKGY